MRKLAYFLAISLFLSLNAAAQEKTPITTDVFLGYSYVRANPGIASSPGFNMNGGTASLALNPRSWFGIAGDFSGYHMERIGSQFGTLLFGPRVYRPGYHRVTPFAEALFGAAHTTGGTGFSIPGSRNSFAMAPGGGLDIAATKHVSVRLGEVDYLLTDFREIQGADRRVENNLRVSTGIKFQF
jgi:opacity protein-like surface antigen